MQIRPLQLADLDRVNEINTSFTSDSVLAVEKEVEGLSVTWQLIERPLSHPWQRTERYIDSQQDVAELQARLRAGDGLYLVAEEGNLLIGLLDMEREAWRDTAMIGNILVDRAHRRRGLGREFVQRAVAWGRERNLRALVLETQTNNVPACHFYRAMGFQLCAVDDHFYTNRDIARNEAAIFWYYEL